MGMRHSVTASTTWRFSRGAETVAITRLPVANERWLLLIDGPSPQHRVEECGDLVAAVLRQAELERRLIDCGFCLEHVITHPVD